MSWSTTQDAWSPAKEALQTCPFKKKFSTQLLILFLIEFFQPSLNTEVKLPLNVMPFSEMTPSLFQANKKTPQYQTNFKQSPDLKHMEQHFTQAIQIDYSY